MIYYIDELTDEEIVALTEDQVTELIQRQCAREGVPLLIGGAPVAPEKPAVEPDITAYKIVGFYFRDQSVAQRVADLLGDLPTLDAYYHNNRWSGPQGLRLNERADLAITKERFWSAELWAQHSRALEIYETAKSEYDRAKTAYEKAYEQYRKVYDAIWSVVSDARDRIKHAERVRATFAEYVRIADGDEAMARAFMLKTNKWDEEELNTILGEEGPKDGAEEVEPTGNQG